VSAEAGGPVLGAGVDHLDVAQADLRDEPRQERALAPDALDEPHRGLRERDGQHESRKPGARAEVGDAARGADLGTP
jgi:hypothetical protein